MAKTLVTGGAGFIGSHVSQRYLNQGHQVVIIDNLSTGREDNIPKGAKFYKADISDLKTLETIFKEEKLDVVNHHAAQKDATINIVGGINLLELSKKQGVKKFIYAATGGALYGEASQGPSQENSPINPISHYGVSKYCLEHYIDLCSRLYNINFTILRYANVYGPRQNPLGEAGVIAIFIHAMLDGKNPMIYGDGEQLRDYVYVEDIAKANLMALSSGDKMTINLGTGKTTSVNKLFQILGEVLNFKGKPQFKPKRGGEIFRSVLDVGLAKNVFHWNAEVSLQKGLENTVAWQRSAC